MSEVKNPDLPQWKQRKAAGLPAHSREVIRPARLEAAPAGMRWVRMVGKGKGGRARRTVANAHLWRLEAVPLPPCRDGSAGPPDSEPEPLS